MTVTASTTTTTTSTKGRKSANPDAKPRRRNVKTTNNVVEEEGGVVVEPVVPTETVVDLTPVPETTQYVNEILPVEQNEVSPAIVNENIEFNAKLNQITSIVSSLKKDFRNLELRYARDLKAAQKLSNKKNKKRSGQRTPSGFVKPTRISDELANFLGKEIGTEMARTAVTKEINNYIVAHNLKDKNNGRQINPDDKLNTLLKLQDKEILTYFNLQRYMSPHFAKSVKAVVAVTEPEQTEISVTP
jgi:upstream activation factor subunit UAF30